VNGYGTTKVYEVYTDVNGKRVEVHYEVTSNGTVEGFKFKNVSTTELR
jgi:hypothetical protein